MKRLVLLVLIIFILMGCQSKSNDELTDETMVLSETRIASSYNGIDFSYLQPDMGYIWCI
ncbi:MAG: hypothetical protein LUF02_06165 [Erysipelotrichaceae bacterium]|nr:hypothetical protein [Erysipelotrichaceae bacterium]